MSESQNEIEKSGRPSDRNGASFDAKAWGLGVVGATLAAVVGWFVFGWLFNEGFYALALPGALIGFGFGLLSKRTMVDGGIFCAILAALLMIFCEWHHRPFIADGSLSYFLTHLHETEFTTKLMFVLGVVFAFWFGKGR